jgi:nicotinamidase-related amidase
MLLVSDGQYTGTMTGADRDGLEGLAPQQVAVVLIDFQNDFCHPDAGRGRVPTNTANAATARRANDFARRAARLGAHIIYAQQVLNLARLTPLQRQWESLETGLCVEGSWGAALFVDPIPGSSVVRKFRFDIWQSREFVDLLVARGIEGLIIGGVELRCCVLFAVLGAEERGYRCVVPHDLVSGQDAGEAIAHIRPYLTVVYRAPPTAQDILDTWTARAT